MGKEQELLDGDEQLGQKDYHVTVQVRNGRLKAAMQKCGIRTNSELAIRAGVRKENVGSLLNFKISPLTSKMRWTIDVLRICEILDVMPDEVFPERLRHEVITNKIGAYVDGAQLGLLGMPTTEPLQLSPYEEVAEADQLEASSELLDKVIAGLGPTQRAVLRGYYLDGKTCKELSKELNLTRTRINNALHQGLLAIRKSPKVELLKELRHDKPVAFNRRYSPAKPTEFEWAKEAARKERKERKKVVPKKPKVPERFPATNFYVRNEEQGRPVELVCFSCKLARTRFIKDSRYSWNLFRRIIPAAEAYTLMTWNGNTATVTQHDTGDVVNVYRVGDVYHTDYA